MPDDAFDFRAEPETMPDDEQAARLFSSKKHYHRTGRLRLVRDSETMRLEQEWTGAVEGFPRVYLWIEVPLFVHGASADEQLAEQPSQEMEPISHDDPTPPAPPAPQQDQQSAADTSAKD